MTKTMRRLFSRAAGTPVLTARRAAMTLLVVMLTAMTAGAQSVINDVPYIDANGTEQTVTVIDDGTSIYADGALALLKGELQTLQELPL